MQQNKNNDEKTTTTVTNKIDKCNKMKKTWTYLGNKKQGQSYQQNK